MKEILIMGNILNDFNRLGITVRQTYNGEDYGVCEVTDEEFEILCNDSKEDDNWNDCGWRYCEGSNQGIPNKVLMINDRKLKCWCDYELEDENDDYPEYENLLNYLCDEMGCSQPRNVCALTKDLAKYNNTKLSKLFQKYQGIRIIKSE